MAARGSLGERIGRLVRLTFFEWLQREVGGDDRITPVIFLTRSPMDHYRYQMRHDIGCSQLLRSLPSATSLPLNAGGCGDDNRLLRLFLRNAMENLGIRPSDLESFHGQLRGAPSAIWVC